MAVTSSAIRNAFVSLTLTQSVKSLSRWSLSHTLTYSHTECFPVQAFSQGKHLEDFPPMQGPGVVGRDDIREEGDSDDGVDGRDEQHDQEGVGHGRNRRYQRHQDLPTPLRFSCRARP